ncbi:uncharacterized protein [Ptychodera flava]|uniref:uncharacterized protein n=1 Tax=Ptychodera flava TaxID=63121 RepID=UPI00396A56A0
MQKMCGHPASSSKNCGNGGDRKNQNMTDERGQICNVMQNIRGFCNCSEKKENDNGEDKPKEINFDEPWPKKPDERCLTPMETIVVYRQHDNIRHPVIRKLIKEKWKQFGRREAVFELLRDVTFILLWTPLSLLRPYARACYYFPDDVYRVLLGIAAVVYTLVLFARDLKAGLHKRQRFEVRRTDTLFYIRERRLGLLMYVFAYTLYFPL